MIVVQIVSRNCILKVLNTFFSFFVSFVLLARNGVYNHGHLLKHLGSKHYAEIAVVASYVGEDTETNKNVEDKFYCLSFCCWSLP